MEYFKGNRSTFDLDLNFDAGTPFQQSVWQYLTSIPYGETKTYKEVALAVSHNKAIRAIGSANGANPIPIIVPCHRVIGSDGSLTGFALGLDVKHFLLQHENPHRFPAQLSLF
jgi:methylated-DNA-[protein]-cysteine S-methyltransferase